MGGWGWCDWLAAELDRGTGGRVPQLGVWPDFVSHLSLGRGPTSPAPRPAPGVQQVFTE